MKLGIKPTIGLLTAVFFTYLVLRQINVEQVKDVLVTAKLSYVSAALCSFFIGYYCRIERWRLMLVEDNPNIKWHQAVGPFLVCVAANNVLPLRAGDIMRGFAFNKSLSITSATSIASLFIERLLDLLMVLGILGVALWGLDFSSSELLDVGSSFLFFSAVLIAAILFFPRAFKPIFFLKVSFIARLNFELGKKIMVQLNKIFESLSHISHKSIMPKLLFWSALSWIFEGLTFYLGALSLAVIAKPLSAWVALPVGTLSTIIPSTPGYLGTFDYFTSKSMVILGNGVEASTAYVLLIHLILWLPPTMIGGGYFLLNKILMKKLSNK